MAANSLTIPSSMLLPGEPGYQSKEGYTRTIDYGAGGNPYYKGPTQQTAQQTDFSSQLAGLEAERNKQTAAREKEVRGILDEIIAMYGPGGSYGQGTLAMLERQKEKDVASATQSLVSSGLYGTTQAAGVGKKWEEEIGMPTRAKLEDVRYGALAQAKTAKAQMVTDISQQPIDYGMLAQLTQTAASTPSSQLNVRQQGQAAWNARR
jgi:hypothetical protein